MEYSVHLLSLPQFQQGMPLLEPAIWQVTKKKSLPAFSKFSPKRKKSSTRTSKKGKKSTPDATTKPKEPGIEIIEDPQDDFKQIDRVELLEGAETEESAFQNALYLSTLFLRPSFYGKKLGEMGLRYRSTEIDPFGFDPVYWKKVSPFLEFLSKSYFRVKAHQVSNIPEKGKALLVVNHSGMVPYDGVILKTLNLSLTHE